MPKSTLVKRVSPLPIDNAGSAMQVLDPETKNTMTVTATVAGTVYLSGQFSYPAVVRLASDKDGFFGTGEETTNTTNTPPTYVYMYMYMYTDFWAFRCVSICANCNSGFTRIVRRLTCPRIRSSKR